MYKASLGIKTYINDIYTEMYAFNTAALRSVKNGAYPGELNKK